MKRHRPPQSRAQIGVEIVRAPERSLPVLEIDVRCLAVARARESPGVDARSPVDAQGQDEVRRDAKERPAVVQARLGQEVEALLQVGLDAGQADFPFFEGELVLCHGEEPSTVTPKEEPSVHGDDSSYDTQGARHT